MSQAEFLISGATGRTGGSAIDELLKLGRGVRAYVRGDGEKAAALRERGVEVAIGDFTDINAIRAAMEGIKGAYFLHPMGAGIVSAAVYFAQAAKEAGLSSIVSMSQISARRDAVSQAARDHWIAERVFDWSGVATTHIRPTFFADWLIIPALAKEIWAKKKIEFPFADGRHAPISSEDQGRVIAHLLARPEGHLGKTYSLHGPVEIDHAGIAAAMSEVLGAEITYEPMTIPEWKERMETVYKFSPFRVQHLAAVAQDYQDGIFAGTNDAVEEITGVAAMSVQDYVSKHRAAFADAPTRVSDLVSDGNTDADFLKWMEHSG